MRFVSPLPWLCVVAVLFVPRGVPAAAAARPAAPLAKQTDRQQSHFALKLPFDFFDQRRLRTAGRHDLWQPSVRA